MNRVCPDPGYVIGGNTSQSGATIVTTTDKSGHTVTYTQIPTGGSGGGGGGSPTTSSTALPTCPFSNNVIFTSPMGMQYQVYCNEAFTDESLEIQTQSSLGSCIAACDMYNVRAFMIASPCMGVTYSREVETENCELKTGYTRIYQRNVDSARLLSPYGGGSGNNTAGPGGGGIGSMTAPPVITSFIPGGGGGGSDGESGGSQGGGGGYGSGTAGTQGKLLLSSYSTTLTKQFEGTAGGNGGGGGGGTAGTEGELLLTNP